MFARAIVENVAQMRIAFGTFHFAANHTQAHVGMLNDILFGQGRPETRPTGARFELGV